MKETMHRHIYRGLTALSLAGAFGVFSGAPAFAQSFWEQPQLLGDMGGFRTLLGHYGVTFNVTDSENLLGNYSGGINKGTTMQGLTTGTVQINTGTAFGLQGGTINASALQIHGRQLSSTYLSNLQTANGNEAENTTRLWELWYDQAFDYNMADFKIGQQSIDNEFMVSKYSGLFVNTMAGWPLVPSSDLYGGGPAYPLASLGARIQFKPSANQAILAGVFNDNPGGGSFSQDAQYLDKHGTKFNFNTGALFIAEYQYSVNQPAVGDMVTNPSQAQGLPGTYKVGFWYDTGFLPDQRYTNPNGTPVMHHGNYSLYAVADQTVWQSSSVSARTVNVFGRIMGAPDRQNSVDFFFNGGVTMTAPLPGRTSDQVGIDFGIGKVSSRLQGSELSQGNKAQTSEQLIEITYQAQVLPWLVVQPDVQYTFNPSGGVQDPNDPTHNVRNELVAGARFVTTF